MRPVTIWFNPDAFTRRLVDAGWPLPEANAEAWQEGTRRLRQAALLDDAGTALDGALKTVATL